MPNEVELKPCPYCGGEAIIRARLGKLYVTAFHKPSCFIEPDTWLLSTRNIKTHIRTWNRRADNG